MEKAAMMKTLTIIFDKGGVLLGVGYRLNWNAKLLTVSLVLAR